MRLSTIVLTVTYWLADIAVALWMGGLVAIGLLLQVPLNVTIDKQSMQVLVYAANVTVNLLDRVRPIIIGGSLLLAASVVLSVTLEAPMLRRRISWWALCLVRSAAAAAMIVTFIYASGDMRAPAQQLEDLARGYYSTATAPDTSAALTPEEQLNAEVETHLALFGDRYDRYMGIQLALGALIFLAGAIRQATWRREPPKPTPMEEVPPGEEPKAEA